MIKTLALVLKKQNVGETDRILTVFSPVLGKKRVIARAIRKPLSKLSGHLDTLIVSQIILTDELDLPKITSAVSVESFEEIRNNLPKLEKAFDLTKLVERVILEDVPQQAIFQITLDALSRLNSDQSWTNTWLYFLSRLLEKLGLTIAPTTCQNCNRSLEDGAYWLIEEREFICNSCSRTSELTVHLQPNAIKLLRLLLSKPYQTVGRINIPRPVAYELEEIFLREITQWLNKPWVSYSSLTTKR